MFRHVTLSDRMSEKRLNFQSVFVYSGITIKALGGGSSGWSGWARDITRARTRTRTITRESKGSNAGRLNGSLTSLSTRYRAARKRKFILERRRGYKKINSTANNPLNIILLPFCLSLSRAFHTLHYYLGLLLLTHNKLVNHHQLSVHYWGVPIIIQTYQFNFCS